MKYQRVKGVLAGIILVGSFSLSAQSEPTDGPAGQGNLVIENIPEIPASISQRIVQYRDVRSSNFLDWGPNSRSMLISTRSGETAQLHLVAGAGGNRQQLTILSEPVETGLFRPGTSDILFASDVGGAEDFHLFYLDTTAGEVRNLTPDGGRNTDAMFSDDGNHLVWSRSAPGARDRNIMMATGPDFNNARVILDAPGSWSATDFSSDGSSLILRHYISNTVASLYILDIASGEMVQVNPVQGPRWHSAAEFSPDGSLLYFLTDEVGEYNNLYRYSIKTGKKHNLTDHINQEIDGFDLSPNGRLLAFTVNDNGSNHIQVMTTGNQRKMRVPRLPVGLVEAFAFSPDSRSIAYTFSASREAGNVFAFRPGRQNITKWTASESADVNSSAFVEPEQIVYPTFDKVDGKAREIPAYVYRPRGEGPHPVVIYIHGGPAFQFRPRFYAIFQYWLNEMGIAVLAPNVRGSTGYGKTYRELDNHMKREDGVKDIGALIDWVHTQKDLDADRIALYGGSYGGYMVFSTMMHYNDQIAGGVASSGISNFVTFLENTRPYRQDLRREEYGDERDPETRAFLQEIAPVNHAAKIAKPLFIIQGRNDPRVPWTEAVHMKEEIAAAGGEPWFLVANDEGHGFRKKSNSDYRDAAIALFYQQLLLEDDGA